MVLPAPLGPRRPTTSPDFTSKETSWTDGARFVAFVEIVGWPTGLQSGCPAGQSLRKSRAGNRDGTPENPRICRARSSGAFRATPNLRLQIPRGGLVAGLAGRRRYPLHHPGGAVPGAGGHCPRRRAPKRAGARRGGRKAGWLASRFSSRDSSSSADSAAGRGGLAAARPGCNPASRSQKGVRPQVRYRLLPNGSV